MTRLPSNGASAGKHFFSARADATFGRLPSGDGSTLIRSSEPDAAKQALLRRKEAAQAGHGGEPCVQCCLPQSTQTLAAYAQAKCRSIFIPGCKHGPFCPRCRQSCSRRVLPACVCRALLCDDWIEAPWPAASTSNEAAAFCQPSGPPTGTASTASGGSALRSGSSSVGGNSRGLNGSSSASSALDQARDTPLPVYGPHLPPKGQTRSSESSPAEPQASPPVASAAAVGQCSLSSGPSLPRLGAGSNPGAEGSAGAEPVPLPEVFRASSEGRAQVAGGTLNLPPRVPTEHHVASRGADAGAAPRSSQDGTASAPAEAMKIKRPWAGAETQDRPRVRTRRSAGGVVLPEVAGNSGAPNAGATGASGATSMPASLAFRRERSALEHAPKPLPPSLAAAKGTAVTRRKRITAGASEDSSSH